MDLPPSFAAVVPSNFFTFTANIIPVSSGGQPNGAGAVDTSEAPAISLCSAFNAAAPANHLPAELVVAILTRGAWSHWWELLTLTHICQHWRNVALGTPQLWADASCSAMTGKTAIFRGSWSPLLPTLLTRSVPCPLRIELPDAVCLTSQVQQDAALNTHFSRLAHLSVRVRHAKDVVQVFRIVCSHIQHVESLHMPHVDQHWGALPSTMDELSSWDNTDLPRLHTLTIHGQCFTRAVAMVSLKTLILCDGPWSHDLFLAALDRYALALESLTLHRWAHPVRGSDARGSTTRTVKLPSLRRLEVGLSSKDPSTHSLALLFAGLSIPPDVAIDLDWHSTPGTTRQLLPKHLVGLHAPSFFDSLCLHLSGLVQMSSVHCYVGDTERLCVREQPMVILLRPRSRGFGEFLEEHRYPTVIQLAVDLDMDSRDTYTPLARGDLLRMFIGGFPNLRRLDLLGKTVRDTKLQMAKAFLDLSYGPQAAALGAGKTLAYVCEVPEHVKALHKIEYVDTLRAQLDQLEALLAAHLAEGGHRLHRLEVCITISLCVSHPSPRVYPYVYNVPPSTVSTSYLSSIYLPRFRTLVDEVVFVGHIEKRVAGLLPLALSFTPFSTLWGDAPPTVQLDQATVYGTSNSSVTSYLNIPFAEPPIGDLRLRLPKAIDHYNGTIDATQVGPQCIQQIPSIREDMPAELLRDILAALNSLPEVPRPESEDCLNLNVLVPAGTTPDAKLPVVVRWFQCGF
ncbi:hypothetical protein LXA43DRAFT_1186232 [Ganoderma leucocontextum]|nr:hypothetical protein LXA43DRAFT_1186232 [Ganoderma leucocontextum]